MKNSLLTLTLISSLISSTFADDLTLAIKTQKLGLKHLKQVVERSVTCQEKLTENQYSESFCQEMKGEHKGFDFYARESEKEVDVYYDQLLKSLNSKRPSPEISAFKKMIDDAYQSCLSEGTYQENVSEPPLKEVISNSAVSEELKKNILFPYNDKSDSFSMDPAVLNSKLMSIISEIKYGGYGDQKNTLERINQLAKKAMQLRRDIYLKNPELILHIANQREYFTNEESFWGTIYDQTGLTRNDFSAKQKQAFKSRLAIGKIYDLLPEYRLTETPVETQISLSPEDIYVRQNGEKLDISRASPYEDENWEKPLLSVDILVQKTDLSPQEATEALLKFNVHDFKSHGADEITPLISSILTGPKREEAIALRALFDEIITDIKELEDENMGGNDKNTDSEDSEVFCKEQQDGMIRDYASISYVGNFYNDPTNLAFIQDTYDRAIGLMKRTIQASNISSQSKKSLPLHLDQAVLDLPEINTKLIPIYMKETSDLYFKAKKLYPEFTSAEIIKSLQKKIGYTDKYAEISRAKDFLGVNAAYSPDDEDGYDSHKISCTCGMSGKAIRQNNPDFLLGVFGHEIGHALDPSFSARTRNNYSKHSLEMLASLRSCLIKNNNNLWTKAGEDYADHWESLFREQMIREDSNKEDWPLRRLKMILEQYSNICENTENVIEPHSINSYRFAHVYSNPALQKEYSEYQIPSVPFCEDIKLDTQRPASEK